MARLLTPLPCDSPALVRRCVCAPYNADFDGDEMNIHVPQVRRCTCWRQLRLLAAGGTPLGAS